MNYSHSRPAFTAITTPAGGAILTDIARLSNCCPRSKTQCTWTAGSQTTSTTMTIQVEWATAIVPSTIGIIGTDLPAGLPVAVKVWNGSAFVAPSAPNNGTIVQRPDGRSFVIVLPTGIAATTKIQLIATNNVGGATALTDTQLFNIGELWVGQGGDIAISAWGRGWNDSTKYNWSFDLQAHNRNGVAQETFKFTPWNATQDEIYGNDSDPTLLDLDNLAGVGFGGAPVLCVPRYNDASGAYSNRLTCRSACFGFATHTMGYDHASGVYFTPGSVQITAPAIF